MISVVMGVSSLDSYLDLAIESILNQTYEKFEFLIITNGEKAKLIADHIKTKYNDTRIQVIQSIIPQLSHALNIGLDHARYEYIARMDADDLAEPDRLAKQFDFLIKNNLDLVGTDATLIDSIGNIIGSRHTKQGRRINFWLNFKSCFIHPSVLYRKKAAIKARGYNAGFNSEDYDLWLRMRRMGVRWDNMSDKLLNYRVHDSASQRRHLGYAEVAGYSLREFLITKKFLLFCAIFFNAFKALIFSRNK